MKKKCIMVLIIVVILFLMVHCFSFQICILINGYDIQATSCVDHSYDLNGQEYKVIKTSDKEDHMVLAILKKNVLGLYYEEEKQKAFDENNSMVSILWMRKSPESVVGFEHEWHLIYYGTNAVSQIRLFPDQLPSNVIMDINQVGEVYMIHFITFSSTGFNNLDVISLLKENQCIE